MPRDPNLVALNVRVPVATKQGVQRLAGFLGVPERVVVQQVLDRAIKQATERQVNGRQPK